MTSHLLRSICLTILLCTTAISQDATDVPGTSVGIAPSGIGRFARGGWAAVAVTGKNPTDTDSDEVIAVYVGENAERQLSRQFWLPAQSQRKTWLPILIPDQVPLTERNVDLFNMRLTQSASGESFATNEFQTPITSRSLMLSDLEINTGMIVDRLPLVGSGRTSQIGEEIKRTIEAGRDRVVDSPLGLGLIGYASNFLPPTPFALDELDQLVIASDRILADTAGVASIRAWLHGGGRVWIMLDRTSDELVDALLGDARSYTRVDRVELNEFEMEAAKTPLEPLDRQAWTSESPVEMVRVMTDVDDVAAKIDGWPTAFWQSAGRGEVLVTTLGARGWLQQDEPGTAYFRVCRRLFEGHQRPVPHAQALAPILEDRIGYDIPSRRIAGGVLAINALLILVAGIWWARQRRLERLAILIPVSAITAAVILIVVGSRSTASVPSTVATGQIVRVHETVDEAHVSTVRAIYSQNSGQLDLTSANGTMTLPQTVATAGGVQRIRWTDDGKSRWVGISQPPGVVRFADSESVIALPRAMIARGTFDEGGFRGTIEGLDARSWQDGVIVAAPAPPTAVSRLSQQDSSAGFRGDRANVLAPGQYISGALLSDDQRLRQDVLRKVLDSPEDNPFGSQPSLLLWTDPFELGVSFAERFKHKGTALVSIPIHIDRPAEGREFQIPTTFLPIESYAGTRGVSMFFNPRTGKWLGQMSKPAEVELMCRFPKAILPLTVNSITVTIKANAPSRTLVVKCMIDGKPAVVYEKSDPTRLIRFDVKRSEALQLHDGGLWFSVSVSETKAQTKAILNESDAESRKEINEQAGKTSWQIDRLHVEAVCTCQPSESNLNDANLDAGTK